MLRRAGRLLADQLGLGLGPGLRALEEAILRQADSLMLPPPPRARSPDARPGDPRDPARSRAPHGRERQLAELETLPERAEVAVAAVSGEPGIGKTWLLGAFRDRCAAAGRLVLWSRCPETEGSPPLWPWLQLLRALTQVCPPPDRRALTGLLDDETPAGSTEAALLRRHQAIADWLRTAARSRPLVVVLDDLHWADPASLRLLSDLVTLLADSTEPVPVTLVTAFRDGPDRLRLDDVLGGWPATTCSTSGSPASARRP
nr:hypothetical protein GCM10020093_032180 [Planobispora longispora]